MYISFWLNWVELRPNEVRGSLYKPYSYHYSSYSLGKGTLPIKFVSESIRNEGFLILTYPCVSWGTRTPGVQALWPWIPRADVQKTATIEILLVSFFQRKKGRFQAYLTYTHSIDCRTRVRSRLRQPKTRSLLRSSAGNRAKKIQKQKNNHNF